MPDQEDDKHEFYDVDKYKDIVEKKVPPPTRFQLLIIRIRNTLDSIGGVLSLFFAISVVAVAPILVVTLTLLYHLAGFVASYAVFAVGLGLYAKRKLGYSMQFGEEKYAWKIIGQLVGFSLVVVIFYFVLTVVFGLKFTQVPP